jgi:hypothetical protein
VTTFGFSLVVGPSGELEWCAKIRSRISGYLVLATLRSFRGDALLVDLDARLDDTARYSTGSGDEEDVDIV